MSDPAVPLPALIGALRGLAGSDHAPAEREAALAAALQPLGSHLGLAGLRLELDGAEPLPDAAAGWGTLAAASGSAPPMDLDAGGMVVGHVWADGDPAAGRTAAVALQAAVLAARAHLRADRAEANLAALDAALHGISGAQSVEGVLQLIVDRVRALADAQYAALGIVGDDGAIEQFLTSGIDPDLRRAIGALPRGHGLLGLLIREGKSIRIPDIAHDPRSYGFPPHHPEMHSFLGVPVTVRGRSVGNLYLTNKRGGSLFSAADQELVERFAMHAGIAIANARLAEQVRQLLVVEERERIGADLHDGVIQRIYGVNLSLDAVPELVESSPPEASRRVEQAIDALNTTIAEIREFIYILRPPGAEVGLAASLHALAAEVRLQTGVPVDVAADDLPPFGGEGTRELLAIAREALSNVARHAGARHAQVMAVSEDGSLRLEIADDGSGFDTASERDAASRGLVNMRRRAERLGGTLEVVSRPGSGTRIIVVLPLERRATAGGGSGRA